MPIRCSLIALVICFTVASPGRAAEFQPVKITLSLKDVTPLEAFTALSKQAGFVLEARPSDLWTQNTTKISLEAENQPFWAVMRELCNKTKIYPSWLDRRLVRVSAKKEGSWLDGITQARDGFMFVAVHSIRTSTLRYSDPPKNASDVTVFFQVIPDPGMRALRGWKHPRLIEAVDDRGQSMLPSPPLPTSMGIGGPFIWTLEAKLQLPPDPGSRISSLKGDVQYIIQTASQRWDIPKVAAAQNVSRPVMDRTFRFVELKRGRDKLGADIWTARFQVPYNGSPLERDMIQTLIHPADMRILDTNGRPLEFKEWARLAQDSYVEFAFVFAAGFAQPASLSWDLPSATSQISVPFEFIDIPLPQ